MADYLGIINKGNNTTANHLEQLANTVNFNRWDLYFNYGRLEIITSSDFAIRIKKYKNNNKNFCCFVIGNIFVEEQTAKTIIKKYRLELNPNDESLLPYLFNEKKEEIFKYLTGNFNLILCNLVSSSVSIISSRFGMIPLYYYESKEHIIFSSKIYHLTQSKLVPYEVDHISWIEHFIFNHFPGEYTGIKNVKLFPPSTCLTVNEGMKPDVYKYWNTNELLTVEKPLNKSKGLELIDSTIKQTLKKILSRTNYPAITLTGGWDSRLVLSYVCRITDFFFLYSFGARGSDDIELPSRISQKLGFKYLPVVLDNEYLNGPFLDFAKKTIFESDGMRSFTRAHYLYALDRISKETKYLISGNCGSNILKTSKRANYIINKELLDLLYKGCLTDDFIKRILKLLNNYPIKDVNDSDIDELLNRIRSYNILNQHDLTSNQRFYLFLFDEVERKYFGIEGKTYNKNLENFSFFIDYDFLKALSQTIFFGVHLPFYHNNLKYRYLTTWLYASLIKINNPILSGFISDKGFSLNDAFTHIGKLKALFKKNYIRYNRKSKPIDTFNTKPTVGIFREFLIGEGVFQSDNYLKLENMTTSKQVDYLTWIYWRSKEL